MAAASVQTTHLENLVCPDQPLPLISTQSAQ